jgi:hypothetical protein
MDGSQRQIFWGIMWSDTDDYWLGPAQGGMQLKVDPYIHGLAAFVAENGLDQNQQVSILGQLGVDPRLGQNECIIADSIASHNDIAVRAFEISQSGRGGSPFDNWLSAERQLLGL